MGMMTRIATSFAGKRVLVTGHTGFKGGWLTLWLARLGAEVHGLALEPSTTPSLFTIARLEADVKHQVGDIRSYETVRRRVAQVDPHVIFHLAAQPLVGESYLEPLATWEANVMGTANVLQAVNELDRPCAVVVVSSDKCYENRNWTWGYRESDPLGGSDPYSSSKGATELVAQSWRESFFNPDRGISVATARAGNVIGGGDWAADRIVPDCISAFASEDHVVLRNPMATRPWQHVLEPLGGYLLLAAHLSDGDAASFSEAWNFGPAAHDVQPVEHLVGSLAACWGPAAKWTTSDAPHPKEAAQLSLNCDKAVHRLNWRPSWALDEAVERTVEWYRCWHDGDASMRTMTIDQIAIFELAVNAWSEGGLYVANSSSD